MVRLAHAADIHIRGLARHAEYRDVLERFVSAVSALDVDALVIAGDIFHSKISGMTPEYVELLTWFTRLLSQRVKLTIVTLGNHDGNLSNQSRVDAVSPIIDAVAAKNVICAKASRAYDLGSDALLHVFSLFDRPAWVSLAPAPDKINIACFHGPVAGAVSDVGWAVSDTETTLDTFNAYDALFLGDIHKCQIFERAGAPWAAYPGSLIQQNFGEDDVKGFLLWEVSRDQKSQVTFHRVASDYKFITLTPDDVATCTPDANSRYRLVGSTRDSVSTEIAAADLRSRGACDIVVRYADDAMTDAVLDDCDALSPVDLVRVAVAMNFDIGSEVRAVEAVEAAMRDARSRAPERRKWSLRAISFDNILSYGSGNFVSFEDKRGIVGLFGPNGVGKSSLVGAVSYVLFNEADRQRARQVSIINKLSDHCLGRAVLDVDGVTYAVERQTVRVTKQSGSEASQTQLNVFRVAGDETIDACGEQRSDTERVLRNLIGDPDECKSTSIATQGTLTKFIDDGPAARRSALSRSLGLAWLEDVHKVLSEQSLLKRAEMRSLTGVDYVAEIAKCASKLREHDAEVAKLTSSRAELVAARLAAETARVEADAQASLIARSEKLQREISELEGELSTQQPRRQKSEIVSDIEAEMLAAEQREALAAHERKLSRAAAAVERSKRQMTVLRDVPCAGSFPSCQFIRDAVAAGKTLPEEESTLAQLRSSAPPAPPCTERSMRALKSELSAAEAHDAAMSRREATTARLISAKEDLASSPVVKDNRDNAARSLREADAALARADEKLFELKNLADAVKIKMLRLEADKKRFDELASASREADAIAQAFSKKGVPLAILRSKIDVVNSKLAELLESAGVFSARASLSEDDLEIEIADGQTWIPVELACGMQRFFVALAFRMVMAKLSPRSPDFFVIDEGFGVLEESNLEAACKLLQHAKSLFSFILIVSHVDYVKDVADHLIEVSLGPDKRSRVRQDAA